MRRWQCAGCEADFEGVDVRQRCRALKARRVWAGWILGLLAGVYPKHNGPLKPLSRANEARRPSHERVRFEGCAALREGKIRHMSMDERRAGDESETEERLRSLIAEYEARLTEVADLVARVRHEINNPLTGVLGQAQLLLREELSETARRRVETIEQLARRITDTVARLRDIQRPATGKGESGRAQGETLETP
jgi:signal transduction histidine kinase